METFIVTGETSLDGINEYIKECYELLNIDAGDQIKFTIEKIKDE